MQWLTTSLFTNIKALYVTGKPSGTQFNSIILANLAGFAGLLQADRICPYTVDNSRPMHYKFKVSSDDSIYLSNHHVSSFPFWASPNIIRYKYISFSVFDMVVHSILANTDNNIA